MNIPGSWALVACRCGDLRNAKGAECQEKVESRQKVDEGQHGGIFRDRAGEGVAETQRYLSAVACAPMSYVRFL